MHIFFRCFCLNIYDFDDHKHKNILLNNYTHKIKIKSKIYLYIYFKKNTKCFLKNNLNIYYKFFKRLIYKLSKYIHINII